MLKPRNLNLYFRELALMFIIFISTETFAQFSSNPLSQAVDNVQYDFLTVAPSFIAQANVFNFDDDAAQSGSTGNNDVSIMIAEFKDSGGGGGTISFDWKVSSQQNSDFLIFAIFDQQDQIVSSQSISGEIDWERITVNIPVGRYTLAWGYVKDGSGASGTDRGYVDHVVIVEKVFVPSLPSCNSLVITELNTALDNQQLLFRKFSCAQSNYFSQTSTFTTGGSAVQSDNIIRYATTDLITELEGPKDLIFDWKISASSEDLFEFALDFKTQVTLTGGTGWKTLSVRIPPGKHSVRWRYRRFAQNPVGANAGFVDNIRVEKGKVAFLPAIVMSLLSE